MRLFKKEPDFKFMSRRFIAFVLSGLIIAGGIFTFITKGFNLGIDFTGGTMVEVSFKDTTTETQLRTKLGDVGLGQSIIQRVGKDENKFFIKAVGLKGKYESLKNEERHKQIAKDINDALSSESAKAAVKDGKIDINRSSEHKIQNLLMEKGISEEDAATSAATILSIRNATAFGLFKDFSEVENADLKKRVKSILKENTFTGDFTFLSTEYVGPQVGKDLRGKAAQATIWALLGMLIYIAIRFKVVYGFSAVITLFHDIMIALSFILFFQIEVSLTVVAALLTIVGYSLNDTIVIFDRVRDNVKEMRKDSVENILDKSINQTLSRTIVTSGTTLITVLALFFLGGEVIHTFSQTLIVGVIVGTYSSIYQSCAWLMIWKDSFMETKKK